MKNPVTDISLRQAAVVTGVSIVIMAIAAVFATDIVLGRLIVPDDAATTTRNIMSSGMLFRAGIFSLVVILVCDVLAAWGLYVYLKPVNQSLSLLMAWIRLVYATILGATLLNVVIVLLLTGGSGLRGGNGNRAVAGTSYAVSRSI